MAVYAQGAFPQLEEKGGMQSLQKSPSGEPSDTKSPKILFKYAWYSVLLI